MRVDVPTMFMMIIVSSFALALCVRWAAHNHRDRELMICTWALVFHGTAYTLYALRGQIPDTLSIIPSNILIAQAYSLLLLSVATFQQRRVPHWLLWMPAVFAAVFFSIMLDNQKARTLVSSILCMLQAFVVIGYLLTQATDQPVRGRNLMVLGLTVNILSLIHRLFLLLSSGNYPTSLLASSPALTIINVASLATLLFIANGLIMMTKDRSDHLNSLMLRQDNLTGCWNRIRVQEIARQEMDRLERYGYPVSLLMFDLDHFKKVNDDYGHATGDEVLKAFAHIARTTLRTTDVLGRWGGEEFVAILPSTGIGGAILTAERIRQALESQRFSNGLQVTTSIGIAVCQSTDHWESWLSRADSALYRAKAAGRNRVETEALIVDNSLMVLPDTNLVHLTWHYSYATGHPDVDREHQNLFRQANALLQIILRSGTREEFSQQVSQLIDLLHEHMQHEEQMLREKQHPDVGYHARLHSHLLYRASELLQRFEQQQIGMTELFHYVVYEVITQHMLIDDKKLSLSKK
ncbi:diguanylate cyclase [Dickeya zeae]|uniref:diguanylate cyclase n=1 Tax=Dickeya zeae TaxID=204042 RepID=UPI000C9C5D9A|nr:diguanylate cyclase [Dickeya zeae]AUQ27047.1 diguanylate cyclase [Dickeya zeae]MCA6987605.1 diguanylate cyclase [Dickeya zeae]UJR56056.1 diguanylate cyclase [Dickeya zeae MS1]UJR60101.1 diguanylate cyclase [Dickeya zeae]UPT54472.1 diguanylate cyclase [Dickeya zeae]